MIIQHNLPNYSMADPLSMAAAITGLISTAVNVSSFVSEFILSMLNAPDSAHETLDVVQQTRLILMSVQRVVENLQSLPGVRKKMIHVQSLVLVFRDLIQTFSKLEALVSPGQGSDGRMHKWDRVKWVAKEEEILRLVKFLESRKSTISLMLVVLLW